ncbi:excalibur calcium-binding domain-containing protein [Synechococcus sp. MU1644]|nr:excalibur calcium-binding domain-containing protein [Synechococcus sp. MU1644]
MILFRSFLILGAAVAVSACQPVVPDSGGGVVNPGRGVGFDNPNTLAAREARDAQLTSAAVPAAPAVGTQSLPPASGTPSAAATRPAPATTAQGRTTPRAVSNPASLDAELAQIAAQNDAAAARGNSGQAVLNASPSNAAPVILNNPGISDENSFDAVASRESIESDAARLEANRQQYQVVQPTALPSRASSAQPNVVQYALQTRHPKGTRLHRRFSVGSAAKFQRNCAEYSSADEAQIDFLARGGPERDRRGIDPDGDGYACGWDPAPFRRAAGN